MLFMAGAEALRDLSVLDFTINRPVQLSGDEKTSDSDAGSFGGALIFFSDEQICIKRPILIDLPRQPRCSQLKSIREIAL